MARGERRHHQRHVSRHDSGPVLSFRFRLPGWFSPSAALTVDYVFGANDRVSLSFTRSTYNTNYDIRGLTFSLDCVAPDFTTVAVRSVTGQGSFNVSTEVRDRNTLTLMPTLVYRHAGPLWKSEAGAGCPASRDSTQSGDRGWFAIVLARRTGVTVGFDDITPVTPSLTVIRPKRSATRGVQVFANGSTQHATRAATEEFQYSSRLAKAGVSLTRATYRVRADVNHRGRQTVSTLAGRSVEPGTARWAVARTSVDLRAEHKLWRQFTVFAKFRNVTDVSVDFEFYGPSTPPVARFQQGERYGALWTLGLKGGF